MKPLHIRGGLHPVVMNLLASNRRSELEQALEDEKTIGLALVLNEGGLGVHILTKRIGSSEEDTLWDPCITLPFIEPEGGMPDEGMVIEGYIKGIAEDLREVYDLPYIPPNITYMAELV